jgi:hypothetical protein
MYTYLAHHPRVFMSKIKEPHHFGSDLPFAFRPYADRARYLELFDKARHDQIAGEASVEYLYSKAAPREIQELSPSAKIIIMLRDPVELVRSAHVHNLYHMNEDLTELEEALAAEDDRRRGRRIPSTCLAPLTLQYTTLARYAEHVQRYRETFGPDRVKCILFEDLKREPDRVYAETLAFLGLEPANAPDFKVHNGQQTWRSRRVARIVIISFWRALRLSYSLPTKQLRWSALILTILLFALPMKANTTAASQSPLPPRLRAALRERFRDDVERLAELLGRDLSSWLQPDTKGLAAAAQAAKSS